MPATPAPTISDELLDHLWQQRCALRFHAWVQVRYQRRRERFFDLVDRGTRAITLVLGASLFGPLLAWLPWVATAISALALLALVFSYGDRKQRHRELAAQAAQLVADVERVPASALTPAQVAGWTSRYAQFCADAPPPLKTLTLLCEREQAAADGHPEHVARPPLWRGWLAQLKG